MIARLNAFRRGGKSFREGKSVRMKVVRRSLKLLMSEVCKCALVALLLAIAVIVGKSQTQAPAAHPQHQFFRVALSGSFTGQVSGRLLVFVGPASGDGAAVDMNLMSPESVYVAAKEIFHLAPG